MILVNLLIGVLAGLATPKLERWLKDVSESLWLGKMNISDHEFDLAALLVILMVAAVVCAIIGVQFRVPVGPGRPGRVVRKTRLGRHRPGGAMIPGEVRAAPGDITLNANSQALSLEVANTGDRPIQVGSHYHFAETNPALAFDRAAALGYRLDIAAGTAVRFEPGQTRHVNLVPLGGERRVFGFNGQVMGEL